MASRRILEPLESAAGQLDDRRMVRRRLGEALSDHEPPRPVDPRDLLDDRVAS
jgi:hypothetical protein